MKLLFKTSLASPVSPALRQVRKRALSRPQKSPASPQKSPVSPVKVPYCN